jgi:phenylacetate-CoA ligase
LDLIRDHFDALESRAPEARERDLFARLPLQIGHAKANCPGFAEILAVVEPAAITDRAALAGLPVTRKSALIELQRQRSPFAGLTAGAPGTLKRIFASPGPIYDPEGHGPDWWRFARALFAAGFRRGDIVHNAFAYHFTPAGAMVESGAHALGCAVFPGGVGQTEAQARAIAALKPTGYAGTPSFLKLIHEKGRELGLDLGSLGKALVSGEALPASLRAEIAGFGTAVVQCYASADLGLIAYESEAREGMILDELVILEIVRPGTGAPVPEGEVGEVVVTSFNPDYPLIRFATGDLSAILAGPSPCGRTNQRIKGWMGRADQTTKVRGMFVHPAQVADVVKRHPAIVKARLVVDRAGDSDTMTLLCAFAAPPDAAVIAAVAQSVQTVCKLRGDVTPVAAAELPNDGKVIEDRRPVG